MAFLSYGHFRLTLAGLVMLPKIGLSEATPPGFMAWYVFMWGVFTFFMYIGTLNKNRALQTIFLTLTILFWLLAVRDWTGNPVIGTIAG